jgi:phosphate transport system ATP-binding protein
MAKRIDVHDLNVYYGDFKAVEGVSLTIEPRSVTAFIGPSGCGKSTLLRTLNRMHEVVPGGRVEGQVMLDDKDLYAPAVDPVAVRRTVGMVFQRPNPFPTMSIYDNVVAGLRLGGLRDKKALDDAAEQSLIGANLWTEVKDRLKKPGAGPLRRSAAAALHRPGHRREAAGAAHGRARARRSTRSRPSPLRTSSRS